MDIVIVTGTDEDDLIDVDDSSLQTSLPQKDNVHQPFKPNPSDLDRIPQATGSESGWKSSFILKRPAVSRQVEAENNSRPLSLESPTKNVDISDEGEIFDETGEPFHPPCAEKTILLSEVSEEERDKFPEYFSGKTKYSPQNYLTIRNTILKLWQERKPNHVNKVVLRPMLKKSSGNVNNIGKIHRFLESAGAINFGSGFVWWKRKRRKAGVYRPPKTPLDTDYKLKRALEQRMSGRNRKRTASITRELPTATNSLGGYTFDHANNVVVPGKKVLKKQPAKKTELTKCEEFASQKECPYDVTVDACAIIVMDVHSHLSTHEVMGLMGGIVTDIGGGRVKVHVACARPCKSSASSRHCEMDAVSQSEAYDWISQRGLVVVGWFHSHPTFPPMPSQVDISTQMEMQNAHDSIFLGCILSPYLKHKLRTSINLIHVDDRGKPFSIPHQILPEPPKFGTPNHVDLTSALQEICYSLSASKSSRLPQLMDPVVQASSITHLDKIIRSIAYHVTSNSESTQNEEHCDIVMSSFCVDNDSYSIDQNFPSLADHFSQNHESWSDSFGLIRSILLRASKGSLEKLK